MSTITKWLPRWLAIAGFVVVILLLHGCVTSNGVACGERSCAVEQACVIGRCVNADEQAVCATRGEDAPCTTANIAVGVCHEHACFAVVCGDGRRDANEACDDGNVIDGDGCSGNCASNERCGNGIVDGWLGEQCDDGNIDDNDGCHRDCRVARCGDGVVDAAFGEACDAGAANADTPNASCRPNCQPRRCGDGVLDATEACDDGNLISRDGCSGDCRSTEVCGNGVADLALGEHCDDGNADDSDACNRQCRLPSCGDGFVNAVNGEGCDQGNANSDTPNASCRTNCQPRRCGDGIMDAGEVCDDGDVISGDGCSGDCRSLETCGNGIVDVVKGEACDDGNREQGDRCHNDCKPPRCGDGILDLQNGEACDLAAANSNAADASCRVDCQLRRCGDAVKDNNEICDDGNVVGADGCSADCQSNEICGNGYRDVVRGEQCDDVNPRGRSGDGCSSTCMLEQLQWRQTMRAPVQTLLAAVTYDSARQRIVMLTPPSSADSYLHELSAGAWVKPPFAQPPNVGEQPLVTYDSVRNVVVLLGVGPGNYMATWEYDGVTWRRKTFVTAPVNRIGGALTFDSTRGVSVLFGGVINQGTQYVDEIWEYDGATWARRVHTGGPGPRRFSALTYDTDRRALIVYGGFKEGVAWQDDVWAYDGQSWSELPGPNVVLVAASAAYHQGARELWVSGVNGSDVALAYAFDGTTWHAKLNVPTVNELTANPRLVYQAHLQRVTMVHQLGVMHYEDGQWLMDVPHGFEVNSFGFATAENGRSILGLTQNGQYWRFDGYNWQVERYDGPHLIGASATFDANGDFVVFGLTSPGDASELWVLRVSGWERLWRSTGNPSMRVFSLLFYDPTSGDLVLYGGSAWTGTELGPSLGDTWVWRGNQWQVAPVGGPAPRRSPQFTAATAMSPPTLLGGVNIDAYYGVGPTLQNFGDMWQWINGSWHHVPAAVEAPAGAYGLFEIAWGSYWYVGKDNSVWRYDVDRWKQVSINSPLRARYAAAGYFDEIRQQLVVTGGIDWVADKVASDVWRLEWGAPAVTVETCSAQNVDADEDGLSGCADPDCAYRCDPYCLPGSSCNGSPHCGDGVCDRVDWHEDYAICPSDCPAP